MKKVVISLRHAHENNPQDYSAAIIYWYGVLDRMGYEVKYYDYNNYCSKLFGNYRYNIIGVSFGYF